MLAVNPVNGLPVAVLMPVQSMQGDEPSATAAITPVPVSIGLAEASAIAAKLDGIELERPTTHQLMSALLETAGVVIDHIEIHDVVDDHLQARIHMILPGGERVARDSRPSDALALALHAGVDICVARHVVEATAFAELDDLLPERLDAGQDGERPTASLYVDTGDLRSELILSHRGGCIEGDLLDVSDEAFGKWKM